MTVVIRGGTVVDGTGAAPVRADVVVEGERVDGDRPRRWEPRPATRR